MKAESYWRRAGVLLGKYWAFVILGVLVVTGALVYGVTQIEFATGQDSYLNTDSQASLDNVEFQDQFGGETAVLLFTADDDHDVSDLFAGQNLAELERVTAELEAIPQTSAVITPLVSMQFSDALVKGAGRSALLAAAQRDPDPDGQVARNADVQIGLARVGEVDDQEIGNPAWNDVLVFGNDNFEIVDGVAVAPPQENLEIRLSLASTFPSQKVAVGGVIIEGNATLDELSAGTDEVIEVLDTIELEGFELIVTGSPVYLGEINDYLKGGMLTLGVAALIVMAVILLLMFRVRWRLLPLLGVVFGVIWTFALLGYAGIDLSLVTISGLPILIGLGIDFAIQIHNRVEEEVVLDKEEHPMAETLANVGPALLVATIGSALAFLALQISQVPMIRDFGVMLAIGVVVLLITGIVLPTAILGIREYGHRTEERGASVVERIVVKLGSLPEKIGPVLVALAVVLFGIGVAVEGGVEIESDPVRWIDQDSQTVADIETLEDRTGFSSTLGVLVEANNVLDADINRLLWDFTLDAEQRPEVVSSSSLVNTMGKIITIPGASTLTPTPEELQAAAEVMPPAIARALLSSDGTATQVNLRLAPASLEERAVIVADLEADLEGRIDALDVASDSVLLVDLAEGNDPVRAVPAGLAVVGVGLLENLSANRAVLTYLGLTIVALWFLIRHRSLARAALALVPVALAVGVSSIIVGAFGLTLSPLTTVSGPLVIATCAEFSILILARYLEERQRGLEPRAATDMASARTGRAFFTSAATTIGGFAVLIGSALPLLRDFGIIVTMNVAVALAAALIVMPPLLVWADGLGWIAIERRKGSVRLATKDRRQMIAATVAGVVLVGVGIGLFAAADTSSGESSELAFTSVPLPTPTPAPTPTPTPEPESGDGDGEPEGIDPSTFGTDRPTGLVDGTLFDLLTAQGIEPQLAVCTSETLLSRTTEAELLAAGIATFEPAAVEPVVVAALDCGISQGDIDATLEAAAGG
ncbi:MAG: MMPL family transporter [Acidimicrobiia bacterium]|nr:MMPL family transporter [Acidimicrobiia bacterium]